MPKWLISSLVNIPAALKSRKFSTIWHPKNSLFPWSSHFPSHLFTLSRSFSSLDAILIYSFLLPWQWKISHFFSPLLITFTFFFLPTMIFHSFFLIFRGLLLIIEGEKELFMAFLAYQIVFHCSAFLWNWYLYCDNEKEWEKNIF